MERYTVLLTHPDGNSDHIQILVPFPETSTVSQLVDEIAKRSAKHGLSIGSEKLHLRLGREDGPILDVDDTLEDTIISPSSEVIFATFRDTGKSAMVSEVSSALFKNPNIYLKQVHNFHLNLSLIYPKTQGLHPPVHSVSGLSHRPRLKSLGQLIRLPHSANSLLERLRFERSGLQFFATLVCPVTIKLNQQHVGNVTARLQDRYWSVMS